MNLEIEQPKIPGHLAQRRLSDDVARQMHIRQYWSTRFLGAPEPGETREDTIHLLATQTGVSEQELSEHTWAEHNLISFLLENDNKEAAIFIAHDPERIRSERPDLLTKITAWGFFIHRASERWSKLTDEVKSEIAIISKDKTAWSDGFRRELKELRFDSH